MTATSVADVVDARGWAVDGARAAGVPTLRSVAPGTDVQTLIEEALTNVTTHSAATMASVELAVSEPQSLAGDHVVRITVHDPGPALAGPARAGRGLVGMRERVALFGGTLSAGPAAAGGFTVDATLGDNGRR